MKIYLVIKQHVHVVMATFDRYELALFYIEVNKDNGTNCYLQEIELSNKLPLWAIKQLEEKYL